MDRILPTSKIFDDCCLVDWGSSADPEVVCNAAQIPMHSTNWKQNAGLDRPRYSFLTFLSSSARHRSRFSFSANFNPISVLNGLYRKSTQPTETHLVQSDVALHNDWRNVKHLSVFIGGSKSRPTVNNNENYNNVFCFN